MRQLNGVYTQRFNRRHGLVGHLFQGRFKRTWLAVRWSSAHRAALVMIPAGALSAGPLVRAADPTDLARLRFRPTSHGRRRLGRHTDRCRNRNCRSRRDFRAPQLFGSTRPCAHCIASRSTTTTTRSLTHL
jgi:hypothetical protein